MANPKSDDLVARESTRVSAASVAIVQTSIDPKVAEEWRAPSPTLDGFAHYRLRGIRQRRKDTATVAVSSMIHCAQPSQDQKRFAASGILAGLEVADAVTNHPRIGERKMQLAGGTQQHARPRFAIDIVDNGLTRALGHTATVVQAIQPRTLTREQSSQSLVHFGKPCFVQQAASNDGLIRHHDNQVPGSAQTAKRSARPGYESDILRSTQVVDVFNEGAIAVDEDGAFHDELAASAPAPGNRETTRPGISSPN
jgi:hypothetical protein